MQEGKKEYGQIKALLPVAGKRMMDWVLERIEEAGVYGESFLLCLSSSVVWCPRVGRISGRSCRKG